MDIITFSVGDIVRTKKPHACGAKEWTVVRVGADVKLQCCACKRVVMLSLDKAKRIVSSIQTANAKEGL